MVKKDKKGWKDSLIFLVKLCLGLTLFAGLFVWNDNWKKILGLFIDINPSYLVLLFIMVFLLNLVSCLKWQLFLGEYGIKVSIYRLLALYCIGKFFNNFFPSTVGGDLVRSYFLGRQIQSQGKSLASVVLERLTGFVALIIVALLFALMNIQLLKQPIIATSFAVVGCCGAGLVVLLLNPRLSEWLLKLISDIRLLEKPMRKFRALIKEIGYFRGRFSLLLKSMGYSFIFHTMTIVQVYLACLTIGFSPRFLDVALVTPIVLMITSIPMSPNKIGVWEWAFGLFLVQAGGEMVEGVAVALIIRSLGLTVSVIGGILLIFEKMNNKAAQPLSERRSEV